jgi:translation initiation factor IF-2
MASKELAEKLIDLGYDIKSHSSTVEDDIADEIRRKVIGTAETEVVEKRISTKGRTTVIRRRSQTVRRAPEPPPEEKEVSVETIEPTEEPPEEKPAPKPVRKKAAKKKKEAVEPGKVAEEAAEEPEKAKEIEPEEQPVVEVKSAEEAEEGVVEAEEKVAEKPVPKVTKRIVPPRKGLAKVIKKAAIHIPEEQPKPPARPTKTARPKGKKPGIKEVGGFRPGDHVEKTEAGKPGKGKKKGKRLVQIKPGSEGRDRLKKGFGPKRKGRKGFGMREDYEFGPRTAKGTKGKKRQAEPVQPAAETKAIKKRIKIFETISVGDLAHRMSVKANQLIAKLMELGVMATVNQVLDVDTATLVAADFGYEVEQGVTEESIVMQLRNRK